MTYVTIGMGMGLYAQTRKDMRPLMDRISAVIGRFANWFDKRFGWFFTNGMKGHRAMR